MCKHVPWIERTFSFDFPAGQYRELLERLRGGPARVEARTRALAPALCTRRLGDKRSIQEHVGHLVDLEPLFSGRLDEFEAGAPVLRAADMRLADMLLFHSEHDDYHLARITELIRAPG